MYHLRQSMNGRPGTVYMGGRPKPTKVTAEGDARLRLVGYSVPDVGFVEYDPERRQVKVLSRSGTVLAYENVVIRFDLSVSALKEAGKKLAYHSSVLLSDIRSGMVDRARDREQAERDQAEQATRERAERADMAVRQKAERAERDRIERTIADERQWVASLVQYLGTVSHKHQTLDKGYMGSPYQTSNTTTEQKYAYIGPWLDASGFSRPTFAKALASLSKSGADAIRGVLGPKEFRGAPIVRSDVRLSWEEGDNLAVTYRETIYYN